MTKFALAQLLPRETVRDGRFSQTQFANTSVANSLCFVAAEKYSHEVNGNEAISCVITNEQFAGKLRGDLGLAVVEDPTYTFYEFHNRLFVHHGMRPKMDFGVHPEVRIDESAVVADQCYVGAGAGIGPGAIVEPFSHIGEGVKIGPGAVVGASGQFFKRFGDRMFMMEHAGGVWLEEGVHVLAGAIISKAVHSDFTVVGKDSVISTKVHVAHGCRVGRRCILGGGVQVSGYTTLGDDVRVMPAAVIGSLLRIGDGARIETGSVVVRDVEAGASVSGNFAYDHRRRLRNYVKDLTR